MRMAMNKKIILRKREKTNGLSVNGDVTAEKAVKGCLRGIGLRYRSTLEAAGIEADVTVTLWRKEFDSSFTHAVIDGTEYRIENTAPIMNDMFIQVMLVRN